MTNRIKVIENAVSQFHINYCIRMLNSMYKNNQLIRFRDNPEVLIAPTNIGEVDKIVRKYSEDAKKIHIEDNGFIKPIYTTEAYLSMWVPGTKAGVHSDSNDVEYVMYSTVVYLNDDYEGGEIYFPNQGVTIKPKAGSMVLFPSGGHEYFHGVEPIKHGNRYTIAMWHTMHEDYSIFDAPDKLNPLCREPHPI